MKKAEQRLLAALVDILNYPDYAYYSENQANSYALYFQGHRADENRLIVPVLLPRFFERVLGFRLGETIGAQEAAADGTPDFIPIDKQTHSFIFDAKGSDTEDLSVHYDDKRKYLATHDFRYLVLLNMRDLSVFTLDSRQPLKEYSFSFYALYHDFKEDPKGVLGEPNTRSFFRFVEKFRCRKLSLSEKLERIETARRWTGKEELNAAALTNRLRHIVDSLYENAKRKKEEIEAFLNTDPGKARMIAQEIDLIASEISPTRKVAEATEGTLQDILNAQSNSLYARALDTFFYRVAYFAMTRLLLVRAWEDIGFIDETLYNGGLAEWYDKFNHKIRDVLVYAFRLASERYKWLFNVDNNYSWFEPSDEVLIGVLYELSNFNLGKLDRDILGAIYEEYIDKVDKKRKGQYYTPREIVGFIWDRVGYSGPDAFFCIERGKRRPNLLYDPATGSGGFLVEAARRLREASDINPHDFQDLLDVRTAILAGLFGSEISVFPYYITEVNLLIQLTPVIKQMTELRKNLKESLPMGVLPVDSLSLHNPDSLTDQVEEYHADEFHNILPLDRQKQAIYRKIKENLAGKFAYCCANPPYVGEKGHKELFRSTLDRYPYWQRFYQGKMDYLYWFIILGLSKLREGGKLAFITTAYWPTADGAAKLRKFILENAKIKEMIFFENVKIFEHAKGQHNMVFVLEKRSSKEKSKEQDENRIKIARVLAKDQDIPGERTSEKLSFLTQHLSAHLDEDKYEDEYIEVFWSGVTQERLPKNGESWNLMYSERAEHILQTMQDAGDPCRKLCRISVGLLTAADKVTTKNIKWLTEEDIKKCNISVGDGVFVLSKQEYRDLNYLGGNIKAFFKNSDVAPYIIDCDKSNYIIYATEAIKDDPVCMTYLSKFEKLLKNSKKIRNEERIPWYELPRKKSPELFEGPKIVTPNRALRNTFGYSEGSYYAVSDIFIMIKRGKTRENLKYILGLLNSSLLNFWTANRNKRKGGAIEFVGSPLSTIPIRRINFDDPEEVKRHDTIVEKVETIRKKMKELSQYSKYFTGPRLTRLGFNEPLPELDERAVIEALPDKRIYSIRTHSEIKITKPVEFEDSRFRLRKIEEVAETLEGSELKLIAKDKAELILSGPRDLLELLTRLLKMSKGKSWNEIKENLFLPDSVKSFAKQREEFLSTVKRLRNELVSTQAEIDEFVYELYGIDETLREMTRK